MSVLWRLCVGALMFAVCGPTWAATLWDRTPKTPDSVKSLDTISSLGKALSTGISADRQTEFWVSTMYRDLGQLNLVKIHSSLHQLPTGVGWIGAQGMAEPPGLYLYETIKPARRTRGMAGTTNLELTVAARSNNRKTTAVYDIDQHLQLGVGEVSSVQMGQGIATILDWLEEGGGPTLLRESLPQAMDEIEKGADISGSQTVDLCGQQKCVSHQWDISLSHSELVDEGRPNLAAAVQDLAGVFSISATVQDDDGVRLANISIDSDPMRMALSWKSANGVVIGEPKAGTDWVLWNPRENKQTLALKLNARATFEGFRLEAEDLEAALYTECRAERCTLKATIIKAPSIQFSGMDVVRSALVALVEDVWGLSRHATEFAEILARGPEGEGSYVSIGVYRASDFGWIAQERIQCSLPDNEIIRFAFALIGGVLPTTEVILEAGNFVANILGAAVNDYNRHRPDLVQQVK
jgi:hypothetical protein